MSSENRFFEEVKGRLDNYTPDAPTEVFGMARNQFLTRRFFRFNLQHFNIWYVGVIVTGVTAAVLLSQPKAEPEVVVTAPLDVPAPQIIQHPASEQALEQQVQVPQEKSQETKPKAQVVKREAAEATKVDEPRVEEQSVEEVKANTPVVEPKSKSLNVKVFKEKK